MGEQSKFNPIKRAVAKAREDSFFFGLILAQYESATGLDESQVAQWLGCSSDAYDKLALCRRPDSKHEQLRTDVHRIARYIECSPERLIQLLRLASSVFLLRNPDAPETELMMAARDRKQTDDNSSDSSEKQ